MIVRSRRARNAQWNCSSSVEPSSASVDALPPETIVLNALKVLDAKLEMTKSELDIVKGELEAAGAE